MCRLRESKSWACCWSWRWYVFPLKLRLVESRWVILSILVTCWCFQEKKRQVRQWRVDKRVGIQSDDTMRQSKKRCGTGKDEPGEISEAWVRSQEDMDWLQLTQVRSVAREDNPGIQEEVNQIRTDCRRKTSTQSEIGRKQWLSWSWVTTGGERTIWSHGEPAPLNAPPGYAWWRPNEAAPSRLNLQRDGRRRKTAKSTWAQHNINKNLWYKLAIKSVMLASCYFAWLYLNRNYIKCSHPPERGDGLILEHGASIWTLENTEWSFYYTGGIGFISDYNEIQSEEVTAYPYQ